MKIRVSLPCSAFSQMPILQHNATSWDNGCQKLPLLTPFLTPVAPRRARDRVPSILALGLFFTRLRFHAARKRGSPPLPSPPPSIYRLSPNRKLQSKNGTPPFLHFWQRDAVDRRAWPIRGRALASVQVRTRKDTSVQVHTGSALLVFSSTNSFHSGPYVTNLPRRLPTP